MKSIWVVDDDHSIRFVLEKALAREGLPVRAFSNVRDVRAVHALIQQGVQNDELVKRTRAELEKVGYTPELLTQTLITGEIPGGDSVAGTMGEVVRDETSQWTDADRAAVVTYLLGGD